MCGGRVLAVFRRRLEELTAALERRRSEDEEKERAVEALTLQLRELVGAGCGQFWGVHIRHSRPDPIPGFAGGRARPGADAGAGGGSALRAGAAPPDAARGHPGAGTPRAHSQPGGASPASVPPPCLSFPFT